MAWFTGLLVFIGFLGFLINAYQSHIAGVNAKAAQENAAAAKGMVEEMKKSSADTHDLAIAAKDQAVAVKSQVEELRKQGADTHALAEAAEEQATNTEQNARAARDSADTLLASERGWVKIADIQAGGDLTYNPDGSFFLVVSYRLVNVGHSVITNIRFNAQMIPEYWRDNMLYDAIDKERAWCDVKRKERPDPRELRTLFPSDDFWSDYTVGIGKQEMYEADRTWPNPYGNRDPSVYPIIVGCVSYLLPFSDQVHQTRFAYNVNFIDPTKSPLPTKINLHGQNPFIIAVKFPNPRLTSDSTTLVAFMLTRKTSPVTAHNSSMCVDGINHLSRAQSDQKRGTVWKFEI